MLNTNPKLQTSQSLTGRHIVSIKDLSLDFIDSVFKLTNEIKKDPLHFKGLFFGKVFATIFFEPSTRTRLSFESAINRLGGRVISVENAKDNSSAYKGESLEDTIQTISNYADCIILRHPDDDSAQRAAKISSVPVINAGAGKNEHPTQALLDAFTIYERFGRLDNLKMTVVGDLMRGRTVYSLVYLLSKYKNNSFTFVSSPNSRINDELRNFLNENNVRFEEKDHLNGSVAESDILYATRIQRERCKTEEEYIEAKKGMIVNSEVLKILPKDAIIMHPLPRVDEITPEVDHDPRAYYFKQVQNGVYLRMGLLAKLFEK